MAHEDRSSAKGAFAATTNEEHRQQRVYEALFHIGGRHAATDQARARATHPVMVTPTEAVLLVELLAAGSAEYLPEEPQVDVDDLLAALTLIPLTRAEANEQELNLITMARGRGLTWQTIAFALGLGSPQAARQRFERLTRRAGDT